MNKKQIVITMVLIGVLAMGASNASACDTCGCQDAKPAVKVHPTTESYPGWRLSIQMWSFRNFTLFEGIDKTASLGLSTIEMYPGQTVSKETGSATD